MPLRNAAQRDTLRAAVIRPLGARQLKPGSAVENLPISYGFRGFVHGELLGEEILHQRDRQAVCFSHHRLGHQEGLLELVRVLLRPVIVVTDNTDGGINIVASVQNFIGQGGAVTVADDIGSPLFRQFKG
ncbi:hypothetical protein D3C81_1860670 [compost metagenome]